MGSLTLKSERQIQSSIITTLLSQVGITDISPGSVFDVLSQAIAQSDFAIMFQISQLARLVDINAMSREELDNKAFEFGLSRLSAQPAIGKITIQRPSSFEKVSTFFSGASSAPISGNLFIDVNDASNVIFGTSGTLVLGRGTNNEEEVTYVTAPVNNVSSWRFTITTGLVNNHVLSETVILKQGVDQIIPSGSLVRVLANANKPEIQFVLDNDTILLSGESEVSDIPVTASELGVGGNINSNSIVGSTGFSSPPFSGARATNPSKFSSGRDLELDVDFRDRIRGAGSLLTKGVKQAILGAIIGAVDPDSAKRVVSASVVLPLKSGGEVKVYIDDGTGFEPSFTDRGFESVRKTASGGEVRLQLNKFPIQKASIESNVFETFDMSSGGLTLDIQVGILQETITFAASDFKTPAIGTAEEVVASINERSTLLEARTSQSGRKVILNPKTDTNETIEILGGTANSILVFPAGEVETLKLYKDDVKLSKDGSTAFVDSQNVAPFDLAAIGLPTTLIVRVDGKTSIQTATFNAVDASIPSAFTASEIELVLNRDISGMITSASSDGSRVRISSNTPRSINSKIEVIGGTANDSINGVNFATTPFSGTNGDFTLNRELGIIELETPLTENQDVTVGNKFTRGKIRSTLGEPYTANNGETLVFGVDGGADQTVTFDGSLIGGVTASVVASFINLQLKGATAISREIGTTNFLEVRTNTFEETGSIVMKPSSGNTDFGFPVFSPNSSIAPLTAFRTSSNPEPYNFSTGDKLIVTVDEDQIGGSFSVPMSKVETLTSQVSTSVFSALALVNTFSTSGELVDYFASFSSGGNTTTGIITTVDLIGGNTFKLTFSSAPANFTSYAVNDFITVSNLDDVVNNGTFLILSKGAVDVNVTIVGGIIATGQTGAATLSLRRQITAYNQVTGQVTVGAAFFSLPLIGDPLIVLPSTINNLVGYLKNLKISSLSVGALVEGGVNNTKLELSSKKEGSDGAIQIASGGANNSFGFETTLYKGLFGYNYWTGLLKLTHKIIYGEDSDLVAFPGVGAAGIIFRILAPTVKKISVSVNVTLKEGIAPSTLEQQLKSVIGNYVNGLGVGDNVLIERIRASVIGVSGVVDVIIVSPLENISTSDNELIRVSDSDIRIG